MPFSFLIKCAIVASLVLLFDRLFPNSFSGARIGVFGGVWLIGLARGRRDVRRHRPAWIALAVAAFFTVSFVDDPGPLASTLFWCAFSVAALLPNAAGFDDAWHWSARPAIHAVAGVGKPFADLRRSGRPRRRMGAIPAQSLRSWGCRWLAAPCSSRCSPPPIR